MGEQSEEEDGKKSSALRSETSVTDATFGALQHKEGPATEGEIREAFAEHAEGRDRRSKGRPGPWPKSIRRLYWPGRCAERQGGRVSRSPVESGVITPSTEL